jgi:hypothetical protein
MCLFNEALLARQAWRLIQFPDGLCSQHLKAKYYLREDLIDTVFPSDASPMNTALKKGVTSRVRDGSKIQVWRDSWIPRPPSLRL